MSTSEEPPNNVTTILVIFDMNRIVNVTVFVHAYTKKHQKAKSKRQKDLSENAKTKKNQSGRGGGV